MQPLRPQVQRAPPRFTTTCPISPAAPRPSHCLPFRIRPPPTPVPHQTPSTVLNSLPAPSSNSPCTATETSLPILTGAPSWSERFSARGKGSIQLGRLRASDTTPVSSSASPGEPTPTPPRSPVLSLACAAASCRHSAISCATSSGPPDEGVGRRASPSTSLPASTTTVWILVPPRSIPPRAGCFEAGLTRRPYPAATGSFAKLRSWLPGANGEPGG